MYPYVRPPPTPQTQSPLLYPGNGWAGRIQSWNLHRNSIAKWFDCLKGGLTLQCERAHDHLKVLKYPCFISATTGIC